MKPFEYARPTRIDDVLGTLGHDGAVRPLAGGTDLLTLMKHDLAAPERLISLRALPELNGGIAETAAGLHLGALTTLAEIETNPIVRRRFPVLAEAAATAATPPLRNQATLGGNLLQRPRCWYFRNPRFDCWLKGGPDCPARGGENQLHAIFETGPCIAVHPSDLATALVALEARARLRGPAGERGLPVADLLAAPADDRRVETVLAPDELIVAVEIPAGPANARGIFLKAMDRRIWSFALVSVAAVIGESGGRIERARIVLGGVAAVPWDVSEAAGLTGIRPNLNRIAEIAERALAGAAPPHQAGYKVPLAKALLRQAIGRLIELPK